MTFSDEVMRSLLSPEAYLKINTAIQTGSKIDRDAADEVAAAMKSWAISKGATHYTHWFQPLTGTTAEKHDSFFARLRDERGDVPGWVLVVLMTTGLVTAIWTIAAPRLTAILKNSLDSMNGIR
jgi:glutamine synthetase type III